MKTLIVYATDNEATGGTSEEIAKVLREAGFEVKVVDEKEEKVHDISEYELVVVGSGLQTTRLTGETEDFLKKFQRDLAQKKVAIFVSSALNPVYEREGNKDDLQKTTLCLEDKTAKHGLHPIAMGIFGGVIDYSRMGLIARRAFGSIKTRLEAAGFKEAKPGVYDTRDWDEIRNWARQLALKTRYL